MNNIEVVKSAYDMICVVCGSNAKVQLILRNKSIIMCDKCSHKVAHELLKGTDGTTKA